ncbi:MULTISPECIES: GtrA family protein [Thiorhodovibrio]|uniref:GtrA family protein n=1 Tax=Thiorhodovibrio TaxID=61593 RepID=UPI001911335C|nr:MULTISPECIES: GtrA family protein [Thiorhodovibrio]MBK5969025.1 hypothetical protein [Thiorhodovibrio winogradskyi]WPL15094.1 GtrA-like protein [Thiorhodovibrio litoralis]
MTKLLRASRFARVGVLATATHILVATSLIEALGTNPTLANALAFCTATLVSYTMNTLWSFTASLGGGSLMRFLVVSLVSLLATIALSALVDALGWPYYTGIACVVTVVPIISFLLHQHWTYR